MSNQNKKIDKRLSKTEVENIAKLARLGITEEEKEKFSQEISVILDYIEVLNSVDTEGVLPLTGGTELFNITRSDEPIKIDLISESFLVEQAPENQDGFIKTPRVLE